MSTNLLSDYVSETNNMLHEVAELNRLILITSHDNGMPNDLLDQRDVLLDEFANIAGVTATTMDNGAARVSLDGLSLVSDTMVSPLTYEPATHNITHSSGALVSVGGELAGFRSYLQNEMPDFQARLNTFVAGLATALNDQHALGFAPDDTPGGALRGFTPGSEARSLTVMVSPPERVPPLLVQVPVGRWLRVVSSIAFAWTMAESADRDGVHPPAAPCGQLHHFLGEEATDTATMYLLGEHDLGVLAELLRDLGKGSFHYLSFDGDLVFLGDVRHWQGLLL